MVTEAPLVHIVDEVPELEGVDQLPMVLALDGFLDAGNAAARAAQHLVDLSESRIVATFDVDRLHDYRARRPPMSFVRDHYDAYDAPRLVVRLVRDTGGTPYLLFHGPEPDNRWEAFARAVKAVVERFGVTRVVAMGSVPMAVPHTRPIAITHHANNPELLTGESPWRGELRIPSSAQALLELRLGEWGHDAMGFVAHIPHYLAQLEYPAASISLLENVERA
ncbi:MAG: PAC2 family protein, partial [Nocardioides sp.]